MRSDTTPWLSSSQPGRRSFISKLLVLDHSYHEKTHSTDFLLQAWLDQGWVVVRLFDHEWEGLPGVSAEAVRAEAPDLLISLQILKPAAFYREAGCSRVLMVPMYDSAKGMKPWDWWEYRQFTFLHFSRTLHDQLQALGIPGVYLQYFPDPDAVASVPWDQRTGGAFYWQRIQKISFPAVVKYLRSLVAPEGLRLHWHRASDPGETLEPLLAEGLTLTESHWFADQKDFRDLLAQQKIFVAPRLAEGIGMSFLEAMAMGCVVVAHNGATMNEYIRHGENGLLVDWENPGLPPAADLKALGSAARRTVEDGYSAYRRALEELVSHSLEIGRQRWSITMPSLAAGVLYWLRHRVLRPIKKMLKPGVA